MCQTIISLRQDRPTSLYARFRVFRLHGLLSVLLLASVCALPCYSQTTQTSPSLSRQALAILDRLESENKQLRDSLQNSGKNLTQLEESYKTLEASYQQLRQDWTKLEDSYRRLEAALTQSEQEYQTLLKAQNELTAAMETLEKSYKQLQTAVQLSPQMPVSDGILVGVIAGAGGIALGIIVGLLAGGN